MPGLKDFLDITALKSLRKRQKERKIQAEMQAAQARANGITIVTPTGSPISGQGLDV